LSEISKWEVPAADSAKPDLSLFFYRSPFPPGRGPQVIWCIKGAVLMTKSRALDPGREERKQRPSDKKARLGVRRENGDRKKRDRERLVWDGGGIWTWGSGFGPGLSCGAAGLLGD